MKNKKYFIILSFLLIITILYLLVLVSNDLTKQVNKDIESNSIIENKANYAQKNNTIIKRFKLLINYNKNESDLLNYIDEHKAEINTLTFNFLVKNYIKYQEERLSYHNELIYKKNIQNNLKAIYGNKERITNLYLLDNLKLRRNLNLIYSNGYILKHNNGKFNVVIDYDFFKKNYNKYLNDEIRDYIYIMENEYKAYENIFIDWSYVYSNIYIMEKFLNNYKESILYNSIYNKFIQNVDIFLYGTDYEQIYEKKVLKSDIKEIYKKVNIENHNLYFEEIFKGYLHELISNNFYLDNKLSKKRSVLIDLLKEKYKKE
ncbi:MAG: hypothetical protein ACQEQE_06210 [Bacillota bacterium]